MGATDDFAVPGHDSIGPRDLGRPAHEQYPSSRRTTPVDYSDGPQDGDMAVVGPTTFVRRVSAHILRWCRLLREAVT